jgi:hypothetical protein
MGARMNRGVQQHKIGTITGILIHLKKKIRSKNKFQSELGKNRSVKQLAIGTTTESCKPSQIEANQRRGKAGQGRGRRRTNFI